ncbi:unnamed protein product [Calypogeia fissa]
MRARAGPQEPQRGKPEGKADVEGPPPEGPHRGSTCHLDQQRGTTEKDPGRAGQRQRDPVGPLRCTM